MREAFASGLVRPGATRAHVASFACGFCAALWTARCGHTFFFSRAPSRARVLVTAANVPLARLGWAEVPSPLPEEKHGQRPQRLAEVGRAAEVALEKGPGGLCVKDAGTP
jgi:hypothetical protein